MNKKDLAKYRNLLITIRQKVQGDLEHLENDNLNQNQKDTLGDLSGYGNHMADVATENYDREFNLDLATVEQKHLNQVDLAIARIDEGTYGVCEDCEKKIAPARLKVVPYARFCVPCQEIEEKKQKRRGL